MSSISVAGDTSGSITIAAPAVAGSNTLTLPLATDTLAGIAATQTLTNKTLVAPALGTPASGVLTNCTGVSKAALPAGTVLQVVNSLISGTGSTTTLIPFDNTIPQITEGAQFLTLAITPISATSKLMISVVLNVSIPIAGQNFIMALFQGATVNALAANNATVASSNGFTAQTLFYFMTSGTTSSTTFTVRAGLQSANTLNINQNAGGGYFGGTLYSSITITEIAA